MAKGRRGLGPLIAVAPTLLFSFHLFGQTDHRTLGGVLAGNTFNRFLLFCKKPWRFPGLLFRFRFLRRVRLLFEDEALHRWRRSRVAFYRHVAIELDVLHRRLNYDYAMAFANSSLAASLYSTRTAANNGEFPLLLKYRLDTAHWLVTWRPTG